MIARSLAIAAALAVASPTVASAQSQLERLVEQDLREFRIKDVDVQSLSNGQLAAIHQIASLKRPRAGKRALILSTIGGRNTLRGLFGLSN